MKTNLLCVLLLLFAVLLPACSDDDNTGPLAAGPTGLTAAGAHGTITLGWAAPTNDITSYKVWRSADGNTFTQVGQPTITAYTDTIASPAGDGIRYTYAVSAIDKAGTETARSATVRQMHGTRLAGSVNAFTTVTGDSPYVIEGTNYRTTLGNLVVDTGTRLYVLDGSTIEIAAATAANAASGQLIVKGELQILATSVATRVQIAAWKSTALAAGEGIALRFTGATSYDAATGKGCLLRYTAVTNLQTSTMFSLSFSKCAPRIEYCKFSVTAPTDTSLVALENPVVFSHCRFDNIYLSIQTNMTGTPFRVEYSVFRQSVYNYGLDFSFVENPIAAGQIANNDFDASRLIDLSGVTGASIPLGNNYWTGGQPTLRLQNMATNFVCVFTPMLTVAPTGVGPGW